MSLWPENVQPEILNTMSENTIVSLLGIKITELKDNYIKGTMPVDDRTVQPVRILHGGASVVLAETLGSIASNIVVSSDPAKTAVGISVNADHIRSAKEGSIVTGIATPINIGNSIHVWKIEVYDQNDTLCCVSRLTTKIINKNR